MLGLAAFLFVATVNAGEEAYFLINFQTGDRDWNLIFPSGNAKQVFRDARTALDIQTIYCDGKEIIPKIVAPHDYPDLTSININGGQVVYQCSKNYFWTYRNIQKSKNEPYEMRAFTIPPSARAIDVRYIIRYPDGMNSKSMRVLFLASSEKTVVLEMQENQERQANGARPPEVK